MKTDEALALTEMVERHGCSCKLDESSLEELLKETSLPATTAHERTIGEDAAVRRLSDERFLVSTVDFFTPILDDPYEFGQIVACNAASDAFATGATESLDCLVTLGLPAGHATIAPKILEGMSDALAQMGGTITGGHTIVSPWPFAGGAITATTTREQLLRTDGASPGEQLYCTKPQGIQPAMGAARIKDPPLVDQLTAAVDRPIDAIRDDAVAWMTTPNATAANAIAPLATAATDVTGFGLAGAGRSIATQAGVGLAIEHLPVIESTPALAELFGAGLRTGETAETSGGLLFSVPPGERAAVESALGEAGVFYRPVGHVTDGDGVVFDDPTIEQISY
ncbi:selenide, water dikinase SelD [Halocatena halophila]|uniref:selenide, water dikinase SelD n=1 Tax=Halocatena halophila TaxID=2814576 RepID=UPI002ED0BF35